VGRGETASECVRYSTLLALCSSDAERFWREDGVVDHYVSAVPDYDDVSWLSL